MQEILVTIAITALVMAIGAAVLLGFYHKKVDAAFSTVGSKLDGVQNTLMGQNEKLAVIHHVVTAAPAPAAPAPAASQAKN
jgi:type II secretory pathway pseudopilin PulG